MGIWTVEDLIKELERYPKDMHIEINSSDGEVPIHDVYIKHYEGENGTKKMVAINPYL